MKHRILAVISGVFIYIIAMSCEETTIDFEGFESDQVSLLLVSSDSFKIWQREVLLIDGQNQPLSGCDQYQQIKFQISDEGDSVFTNSVSPLNGCPAETLISGEWKVSAGPRLDTLFINNPDTSIMRLINSITSSELEYYYFDNSARVTERFRSL